MPESRWGIPAARLRLRLLQPLVNRPRKGLVTNEMAIVMRLTALVSAFEGWPGSSETVAACFCIAVHVLILFEINVSDLVGSGNAGRTAAIQSAVLNNNVMRISNNLDLAAS